jgi:N-hydroxyarylamine O-acetyltransferase
MDQAAVTAYLDRLGLSRPAALDAAALRLLHHAHLLHVPFENLSIHLGEPVSLAEDDLIGKLVHRRRGGFCYELNGGFALLLEALGAQVTRLSARVWGAGRYGPPFDHLALLVRLPDGTGPWLADVGFGRHTWYPLDASRRDGQDDPGGQFLLAAGPDGDLDLARDGEPQYRIETRARSLADFEPTCWWQQTWPESHFRQGTICSRLTADGRVSVSGRTLIRTTGRDQAEQPLASDAELLAAYREHFGIVLDRAPDQPR